MVTMLEALKDDEALNLPKLRDALGKLFNQKAFVYILCEEHVFPEELLSFCQKAVEEGNAFCVQREFNGYYVLLWKDK